MKEKKKAVYKAGQIGCKVVSEEKPWKKKLAVTQCKSILWH